MRYLRTNEATDWPKENRWKEKLINVILFFVPRANPDYENKMYLVKSWLIEFVENEGELIPWREIALDKEDKPIFAGPSERNYGFWLDTNMKYEDFDGDPVNKDEFERYWNQSGVVAIDIEQS